MACHAGRRGREPHRDLVGRAQRRGGISSAHRVRSQRAAPCGAGWVRSGAARPVQELHRVAARGRSRGIGRTRGVGRFRRDHGDRRPQRRDRSVAGVQRGAVHCGAQAPHRSASQSAARRSHPRGCFGGSRSGGPPVAGVRRPRGGGCAADRVGVTWLRREVPHRRVRTGRQVGDRRRRAHRDARGPRDHGLHGHRGLHRHGASRRGCHGDAIRGRLHRGSDRVRRCRGGDTPPSTLASSWQDPRRRVAVDRRGTLRTRSAPRRAHFAPAAGCREPRSCRGT